MLHVPGWRIDRLLQIHAHCGVANKKSKRPLILLVAARSAKSHIRLAIAQGHSGRQGRVGTHAGTKTAWNALVQPGHLQTRIDGKTELGNGREIGRATCRERVWQYVEN